VRPPHLLVDVTQFVGQPATSGVQRTLWHLAKRWPGNLVEALFGTRVGDRMITVEPATLAQVIGSAFERRPRTDSNPGTATNDVLAAIEAASTLAIPVDDLDIYFDGYLLPEPTWRPDVLATAAAVVANPMVRTFALVYDALPQVSPWHFGGHHQLHTSAFFRLLTEFEHVAAISDAVAGVWTDRLRRRPGGDMTVIRPGADAFLPGPATAPAEPAFVAIGTVEPRKRYALLLAAMERLWASKRPWGLDIYGGPLAIEDPKLVARLDDLASDGTLVRWHRDASDDELRAAILRATAVVFLSRDEGYGLPPLEALRLGVPVIVDDGLPALEATPTDGQIRLHDASVDSLVDALIAVADPERNAELRAGVRSLSLPSWSEFAARVEGWVADRIAVKGSL
jgi:glycosyltransferase involved in cell wall biosynthesis